VELVQRYNLFMGSNDSYEEADTVITGVPMDFTVSYRPGSRFAPQAVRNGSYALEEYSFYLGRDLADYSYYDWGDINLPLGNVTSSLARIAQTASRLFNDNKFPIFIGGEHLISYPVICEAYKKYPGLVVLQFDAHADLRAEYLGETNSHATVMRRVYEVIGGAKLYQFGIRSGTRDEFDFARENTSLFANEVIEPLRRVVSVLGDQPVYITIDIDVVDPAYAPGAATMEPGGITARELIEAVHVMQNLNVIGLDIVEITPAFDHSERTSFLGAKVIRESILGFTKPGNR